MKRKKIRLFLVILFIVVGLMYLLKPTSIIELDCYKSLSKDGLHLRRVFLVKSPPFFLEKFKAKVDSFKKKNTKGKYRTETLLFIKERDINIIEKYFWGDNNYYSGCNAKLNSEDFLGEIFYYKNKKHKWEFSFNLYEGEYYYY